LQDKGFYKNSKYVHLWMHILLKATHKPMEVMWNGKTLILNSGQFITGRKKLEEETKIKEHSVDRILNYFKNEHQIEQQTTNQNRLITILKWERYQGDEQRNEQPVSNKRATSEQPVSTNKNNKNVKNEKNKEVVVGTVSPKEVIIFSFKNKRWEGITKDDFEGWQVSYPACKIEIELLQMAQWLLSNPEKKKSRYRRFITNWLARSQDKGGTRAGMDRKLTRTERSILAIENWGRGEE